MPIATHEVNRATIGLGTFVTVQAVAPQLHVAHAAVSAAFAAITRVDRLMHPSREGSDLRAIRDAAPGVATRIDPWTHRVLLLSRRVHHASRQRFDPCLSDAPGRFGDLDFDAATPTQSTPRIVAHAPVHIDLGGIAKGFAVDRALEALRHAGCHSGLVNCGGDLAMFGEAPQRIACAAQAGSFWVTLVNGALASSDTHNPDRPAEHRGYYDGHDRSLLTAGHAVVRAPTAAVADAMTKCVLILGREADAVLRLFDAELMEREGAEWTPHPP